MTTALLLALAGCGGWIDQHQLAQLQGDWVSGNLRASVDDVTVDTWVNGTYWQRGTITELTVARACGTSGLWANCYSWEWGEGDTILADGHYLFRRP